MALFCYVTDQVEKDATTHGIAKARLTDFAHEVEKRQSLAGFDHFPPPCLTKKKIFGYNFRLIAVEKQIGGHLVVVLIRLVIKGHEYNDFEKDPATWAIRYYDTALDSKLKDWVDERTRTEPLPLPPQLSAIEQTFLWSSPSSEEADDLMVCETHEWVRAVRESRIVDRLIRLPALILKAIDGPAGEVQFQRFEEDNKLAIMACKLPASSQCLLLSVSYGESDSQLQGQKADWVNKLASADAETVLRYSRRSYPSILCCDDDMWMAVQKDPQANLALSPEEADILRACNMPSMDQSGFPLFINGRAGSGKSTLLQYLFAQCLLRWAGQPDWASAEQTRPLYVASSAELLKVAREVVGSLLKASRFYQDARDSDRVLECLRRSLQDSRGVEPALVENAFRSLIAGAKWESFISFLLNGQPSLKKQERWEKGICTAVLDRIGQDRMIYKVVIPALARSEELSNADGKAQQPVSDLLNEHLIKTGYAVWQNELAREVAGAAIERAGRHIDALQFYESWRDSAESPVDREYAERRWVISKLRQATRQEREGLEKKANSTRQEAKKVMEKYGWTDDAVPDAHPTIDVQSAVPVSRPAVATEPLLKHRSNGVVKDEQYVGDHRGRLGSLSYRVITHKGWINLDSDDGLQARVLVRDRMVKSNDVKVRMVNDHIAECEEWGLQVCWLSEHVVEFRRGEEECQVAVGHSLPGE